ncbi:TetR/AcrR family transcriptional regulator [Planotetraspora phitsanulokensis]|uniref:TetR/AcrR family transcriptional regulator n=1 Tax=Planotetraspora phitsanulokensis TaxID=575192 RepID=UPI00194EE25C|nr:TetR/AcrR family transcriptional regulator [Planotetraspora phitsanulokensis]
MSDGTADRSGGQVSRRAEYAEATRQAIVDASRRLFAERGFFATKVDDIARAARVAPATVYAVAGGKQGLLRTLMDAWTTAPVVAATLERIERLDDPVAILRTVATVTREMRQEFGDIMRVMIATAPHDQAVAESLKTATARYRAGNAFAGRRLAELGALRPGLDAKGADDILWFYFGYSGLFTLVEDNGWTYSQAEEWLVEAAGRALF